MIYLTGEQLYINAHQKEIILAISSQSIHPDLVTATSTTSAHQGSPLGLTDHLGLADWIPRTKGIWTQPPPQHCISVSISFLFASYRPRRG